MTYRTCLYYVPTQVSKCYHMTWMNTKKLTGVMCGKLYRTYKLCPYHPKYKEYKDASAKL
jgi:hypothetical protein